MVVRLTSHVATGHGRAYGSGDANASSTFARSAPSTASDPCRAQRRAVESSVSTNSKCIENFNELIDFT